MFCFRPSVAIKVDEFSEYKEYFTKVVSSEGIKLKIRLLNNKFFKVEYFRFRVVKRVELEGERE